MNAERWGIITALFADARSVPRDERADFLDRSCHGDAKLRADVESLLAADDRSDQDGFMTSAPRDDLSQPPSPDGVGGLGRAGRFRGRRIGCYQLQALIGKGGTSEVYRAIRVEDGPSDGNAPCEREFALKLIQSHMATQDVLRRFHAEQELLATIDHPNIARFVDRGLTDDGLPYLVMEFIEGQRIDRYCEERNATPAEQANLLILVCDAVSFLHQRAVLHRDLSPSNILITPQGVPKLVDFGIAKSLHLDRATLESSHRTAPGAILGTPEYLSPEQAMGRTGESDVRTDVYTLGVLLYRLLTGRSPFQGVTLADLLDEIRNSEPVRPTRLKPGLPRSLETICLTCLQKNPSRRYASIQAMAEDMRRWLDGRPIAARPVSRAERAWRWCRRRPSVTSLIAALAAFTMIGSLGLLAFLRHSNMERALAEAGRWRAEETETIASHSFMQLHTLILNREREGQLTYIPDFVTFVQGARQQIAALKQVTPVKTDTIAAFSAIERDAGRSLLGKEGRFTEATKLIAESVELLNDCHQRNPDDENIRRSLIHSIVANAWLEFEQGRPDEVVGYLERGAALLGPPRSRLRWEGTILMISDTRRHQAYSLSSAGQWDQAQRLVTADLRMLDSWSAPEEGSWEIEMLRAIDLAYLGQSDHGLAILFSVLEKDPDMKGFLRTSEPFTGGSHRYNPQKYLTEWLAVDAVRVHLARGEVFGAEDQSDPPLWAKSFVQSIHARCLGIGLHRSAVPLACETIAGFAQIALGKKRRDGKQEEASRIEKRLTAIAWELVRSYPNQSSSHIVLSIALLQSAKNAWNRSRDAEAVDALEKSRDAARNALEANPTRSDVRGVVDDRERRLQRTLAG